MNLLFDKTDVAADLPLEKRMKYKNAERQLAEIKRQTVPQEESDIWRNPLNNQTLGINKNLKNIQKSNKCSRKWPSKKTIIRKIFLLWPMP